MRKDSRDAAPQTRLAQSQHQQYNAAFRSFSKAVGECGEIVISPGIRVYTGIPNIDPFKVCFDVGLRIRQVDAWRLR